MSQGERRSKEALLDVWRRDMDPEYTRPLEEEVDGRGLDVLSGIAAVLARASQAVETSTQAFYLHEHSKQLAPPASGEVRATGILEVYRRNLQGGAIALEPGDVLVVRQRDTEGEWVNGIEIELTEAVVIPPAAEGPTAVAVRAVRPGFQGNVPPGRIAVFKRGGTASVQLSDAVASASEVRDTEVVAGSVLDLFTEDMVGRFFRFGDSANASRPAYRIIGFVPSDGSTTANAIILDRDDFTEPEVPGSSGTVLDIADLGIDGVLTYGMSGGRHGELDMLGSQRLVGRTSGEDDESLRERISTIADTVSPGAIERALAGLLGALGVGWDLVEIRTRGGRGWVWNVDAYNDPTAWRHGRFFYAASGTSWVTRGFLVVIDGSTLPLDETPLLNALIRRLRTIKAHGIPFALAFEPPIGSNPFILTDQGGEALTDQGGEPLTTQGAP